MDEEWESFGAEPDQENTDDAVPVCPKCLRPCNPLDYYCPHCGSNEAINPLAPYISFVNIRFNVGIFGKLWNRCFFERAAWWKKILYLFLLVFWIPWAVLGLPFVWLEKIRDERKRLFLQKVYMAFLIFFCWFLLWR